MAAPVPPLVEDLDAVRRTVLTTLSTATESDWDVPATELDWTCWETLEHLADDLFAYAAQLSTLSPSLEDDVPFTLSADHQDAPRNAVHARRTSGNVGLIRMVDSCFGFLAVVTRTAPPDARGWHPFGVSDPAGFAAMGLVEAIVHLHDVTGPLRLDWQPDPGIVRRVLERLFPDAPTDQDPWETLLWATGRGTLPGRDALTRWRWDGTVR